MRKYLRISIMQTDTGYSVKSEEHALYQGPTQKVPPVASGDRLDAGAAAKVVANALRQWEEHERTMGWTEEGK